MQYRSENKETPTTGEKLTGFRALNFFSDDTNWSQLEKNINTVEWDKELKNLSPDETLKHIIDRIINLCKGCVPLSKKSSTRKHHIPKYNRILMRRKRL